MKRPRHQKLKTRSRRKGWSDLVATPRNMQSHRPAPEDHVREESRSTRAQPTTRPHAAATRTTATRARRSAFMSVPSDAGQETPPSATEGGRARLQDEQLGQLRELFLRFDLDGDGSLTKLEIAALLRSLGLRPAAGDEIHTLIASMDADGNGTVEFDELASSLSQLLLGPGRPAVAVDHEQLAEAFRAFDRDGNGYISAAELARSMAQMGHPICYAELTDMMREADTDGDGSISFEEFTAIMAKSAVEFLGLAAL
ncbi:probable calcium-binding protein CML12 [Hordeum vulgare subsp. vulgare]|uniref:EF-hand domain-containing protein n=2 Tax=Hordeum vulgare subsp. vulgare TaxID=112509 RepID=A0A8I7B9Z2_HORVV|nr:probable calcium-binding protein CML12 [Hordeum vulgare subsp. vulgare]